MPPSSCDIDFLLEFGNVGVRYNNHNTFIHNVFCSLFPVSLVLYLESWNVNIVRVWGNEA